MPRFQRTEPGCEKPLAEFVRRPPKGSQLTEAETPGTQALLVPAQPVTGAVLGGRYRLLERIGRGGMADVFSAEDGLLTRRVAVKIFRFDLCTEEELRRVHAEMQTLAALHHPGLVTVFDAGTVHEAGAAEELASPYLVMELVNGPNLGQRLASGPLSQAEAAQLGTELAATLAYVHARDVIHRDVKPANILLDSTIAADAPFASKLTDFGIARVVDSTHYTEAGFTVGTANYLSPEQALSAEVGTATDVYSLGLVLLECLTGELAFPGSGVEAALARLNRQPEIPAWLDAGWQQLLAAATDREPANRPTAAELGAALRSLAAGGGWADSIGAGSPDGSSAGWTGTAAVGAAAVSAGAAAGGTVTGGTAARVGAASSGTSGAASFGAASSRSSERAFFPADFPAYETGPAEDAAATEAIRLVPAAPPVRHPRGGMLAAAVLVLAALLTSGFLLRSGHAAGNQSPGTPVNYSSTTGEQSSASSSAPRSSAPAAAVVARTSSHRVFAPPPSVATTVVTQTVTHTSTPTSVAASSSAPASPTPPPSSASASPTSSAPSASASSSPTVSPTAPSQRKPKH